MAGVAAEDSRRAGSVAEAVVAQAAERGVDLPADLQIFSLLAPKDGAIGESSVARTESLAEVLEAATSAESRQANGLHVTPDWLANDLVSRALTDLDCEPTVCDPACGGGAFLLATARRLEATGLSRRHIVRNLVWGADVDPVGLATAEAALALWAGQSVPKGHLVVGDALMDGASVWPAPPHRSGGFAAVVGNPPFLSPLVEATARSKEETARLRARYRESVRAYTDTAWLFLLLATELTRPGGRVALLQPISVVAARDSAALRNELNSRAELCGLWVQRKRVFAANTTVCAPILQVRHERCEPRPDQLHAWAERLADSLGVPALPQRTRTERLGDRADAMAGFRDEFYGVVPFVREADDGPEQHRPLVTCGLLKWGSSLWGQETTRFAKARWQRPVVDLTRPPSPEPAVRRKASRWIDGTSHPKVVVATQTKVVEAAVDESGAWVPCVPVIAVVPHRPDGLWRIAAALSAPYATAWLMRRAPGTAQHLQALKIAVGNLSELPLPTDEEAWDAAADAFRDYSKSASPDAFEDFVASAAAAYATPPDVTAWWRTRLP